MCHIRCWRRGAKGSEANARRYRPVRMMIKWMPGARELTAFSYLARKPLRQFLRPSATLESAPGWLESGSWAAPGYRGAAEAGLPRMSAFVLLMGVELLRKNTSLGVGHHHLR